MFSDWENIVEESLHLVELTEGKNEPNDKKKWDRAIEAAKNAYDTYPSAYANAFAAKKYKEMGGTWKKKKN
jgi:hypothetical protein